MLLFLFNQVEFFLIVFFFGGGGFAIFFLFSVSFCTISYPVVLSLYCFFTKNRIE